MIWDPYEGTPQPLESQQYYDLKNQKRFVKGKKMRKNKHKPSTWHLEILATILTADNAFPEDRKSYLPRRCVISGKLLWFRNGIRITRHLEKPIPYKERLWADSKEWTVFVLKNSGNEL
jgi:hypothetical protein